MVYFGLDSFLFELAVEEGDFSEVVFVLGVLALLSLGHLVDAVLEFVAVVLFSLLGELLEVALMLHLLVQEILIINLI